jgi:hypothetical protein
MQDFIYQFNPSTFSVSEMVSSNQMPRMETVNYVQVIRKNEGVLQRSKKVFLRIIKGHKMLAESVAQKGGL